MSTSVAPAGLAVEALAPVNARAIQPRVLFVNHSSRLGGAEFVLIDVATSLAARSSVWLFEDGPLRERLRDAGVKTQLRMPAHSFSPIKRDRSLLRALPMLRALSSTVAQIVPIARRHDLIYANSQKAFVLSAFVAMLSRRPLVWHLHDILTRAHFGRQQIRLGVLLANLVAERVIVPSRAVGDAFVAAGGRASKLRVVPLGLVVPDEVPAMDRQTLRDELGLPSGFLVGVFNRLAPWKGQHIVLEAMAALPHAQCIVVGGALFGEEEYRAFLLRRAEELGIQSRVRFLGHRNDVARLMRAVDVVVHSSVEPEPFGRVMVEAMLCRTPVIAPNAGGAPDILGPAGAELLYAPGDAAALARTLANLGTDQERCARLTEAAAERARTLFRLDDMCRHIETVLQDLFLRDS